jgi:hypothetical protein
MQHRNASPQVLPWLHPYASSSRASACCLAEAVALPTELCPHAQHDRLQKNVPGGRSCHITFTSWSGHCRFFAELPMNSGEDSQVDERASNKGAGICASGIGRP